MGPPEQTRCVEPLPRLRPHRPPLLFILPVSRSAERRDTGGTVLGVSRRRERSLTRTPRIRSGVGGATGAACVIVCFEARLWNSDEWACAVVCGFPLCSYGR